MQALPQCPDVVIRNARSRDGRGSFHRSSPLGGGGMALATWERLPVRSAMISSATLRNLSVESKIME